MFKLLIFCAVVKMCIHHVTPLSSCDDLDLTKDGELCWLRLYLGQLRAERDSESNEFQEPDKRNDFINSALYSMYVNKHHPGKRSTELRNIDPFTIKEAQKRNEVTSALYSLLMNPGSRHTRNPKFPNSRKN